MNYYIYSITDSLFYCIGWSECDAIAANCYGDDRGVQEEARKQAAALAMVDWLRGGESIDR